MRRELGDIWVALLESKEIGRVPDYRIQRIEKDGSAVTLDDPYRHAPRLGELELYRLRTGGPDVQRHLLGAHLQHYTSPMGEVEGTGFVVHCEDVTAVRVCGDFNIWNGSSHAMRRLGNSWIWEIFIPGVGLGAKYRFEYLEPTGTWVEYADPLGHYSTEDPDTICLVQAEGFEERNERSGIAVASAQEIVSQFTESGSGPICTLFGHIGARIRDMAGFLDASLPGMGRLDFRGKGA